MNFKGTNQKWCVNSAAKQEVNTFNGISIADCSKSVMISNEEKEANATLISAAPDLLESLVELVELLELHKPNFYLLGHYRHAKTAINKAVGSDSFLP